MTALCVADGSIRADSVRQVSFRAGHLNLPRLLKRELGKAQHHRFRLPRAELLQRGTRDAGVTVARELSRVRVQNFGDLPIGLGHPECRRRLTPWTVRCSDLIDPILNLR